MLQFNLLPDIKIQYVKAARLKKLIITISFLVAGVTIAIFVLLFLYVDVAQKKHINDVNNDIKTNTNQLTDNIDLNKILTIQNQLQALPKLQAQRPVASRMFTYLTQVTPTNAHISSCSVDFNATKMIITGKADTIKTINEFVDTLKFTSFTYQKSNNGTSPPLSPAFSNVVLTSYGLNTASSGASYSINLNFVPQLFDQKYTITLVVPQQTTTRSITEQPKDLFQSNT